jgi:hypothetical protein
MRPQRKLNIVTAADGLHITVRRLLFYILLVLFDNESASVFI